ncbi:MAG TPA: hypothetical protein VMV92_23340 [Streptosporangiaceae bacterium]|nr:hypothetical protein [Streptosporangiaceae bacterium]
MSARTAAAVFGSEGAAVRDSPAAAVLPAAVLPAAVLAAAGAPAPVLPAEHAANVSPAVATAAATVIA